MNKPPDCADLGHILYEIEMFSTIAHFYLGDEFVREVYLKQDTRWLKNAILESGVMHTRLLAEFFENPKPDRKDDTHRRSDYPVEFKCNSAIPVEDLARMHKEVAHLSFRRSHDPDKKNWELRKLVKGLEPAVTEFLTSIQRIDAYKEMASRIDETRAKFEIACRFAKAPTEELQPPRASSELSTPITVNLTIHSAHTVDAQIKPPIPVVIVPPGQKTQLR